MNFDFRCPKCGAEPHTHGSGRCNDNSLAIDCEGLICNCEDWDENNPKSDQPGHGVTLENPCRHATCSHCGWGGTIPKAPKGLQGWEKKALEAGWIMPANRAKELKR